jgi:hypothetical protein
VRFPITIQELARLEFQSPPVILEVGASDGSTSLDIIQVIPFEKYFVTDLNIEIYYIVSGATTWFYDENGICVLRVSNRWVVYPEDGTGIFPFNKIAQAFFKRAPKCTDVASKITLINPLLQAIKNNKITIQKYNIFEPWFCKKVDLIIAANILNLSYFTASEIIQALKELTSNLNDKGRIAIIENRPNEQSSIFQFSEGNLRLEKRINLGSDIEFLVPDSFLTNNLSAREKRTVKQV